MVVIIAAYKRLESIKLVCVDRHSSIAYQIFGVPLALAYFIPRYLRRISL